MKNPVDVKRRSELRDPVELFVGAIADAIADRLAHRDQERRRLLDMERTTEYLGLSEDTIYRLVAEKKLTPVRVDRRMRFDIRELDELIEEAKKQTAISSRP